MRTTFLGVTFFLFTLVARPQLSAINFGSLSTLDILTWNIEHYPKSVLTTDSLLTVISSLDADILALQEIEDTTIFKYLTSRLPAYQSFFLPQTYQSNAFLFNSNEITFERGYLIYNDLLYNTPFPRPPLVMAFNYRGGLYYIINVHLKCCGNGTLDVGNPADEEYRRLQAIKLLKKYTDNNLPNNKVIICGDFNDEITDEQFNNVFTPFLNDAENYHFADMQVAYSHDSLWSYPSWPSHIDHLIINHNLFTQFNSAFAIPVHNYLQNGFKAYNELLSDHLPVGVQIIPESLVLGLNNTTQHNRKISYSAYNNRIMLWMMHDLGKTTICVYNACGKQLIYRDIDNQNMVNIKTTGFTPGIYVCTVQTQYGNQAFNFLKH